MTRYRIQPYRQGSRSALALAEALGGRVLKIDGTSRFRPRPDDVIINWGDTNYRPGFDWVYSIVKNRPPLIRGASNKLEFFQNMSRENDDIIPPFWTNRGDIPDDAFPIVCRTILAGHSGAGIVIANSRDQLVDAALYVKYIKKQEEYRIHVGRRNQRIVVISIQRKARSTAIADENVNWQVRNHANGFVFVRGGVNPPESVIEAASRALETGRLDFGAVDVIWNARQEQAYVLEINTAPGLEGQTVTDYANFFRGVN